MAPKISLRVLRLFFLSYWKPIYAWPLKDNENNFLLLSIIPFVPLSPSLQSPLMLSRLFYLSVPRSFLLPSSPYFILKQFPHSCSSSTLPLYLFPSFLLYYFSFHFICVSYYHYSRHILATARELSPEHERYWLLFISRCLDCPFVNKTEVYIIIFWLLVFLRWLLHSLEISESLVIML